jgi:hypothetical protein
VENAHSGNCGFEATGSGAAATSGTPEPPGNALRGSDTKIPSGLLLHLGCNQAKYFGFGPDGIKKRDELSKRDARISLNVHELPPWAGLKSMFDDSRGISNVEWRRIVQPSEAISEHGEDYLSPVTAAFGRCSDIEEEAGGRFSG